MPNRPPVRAGSGRIIHSAPVRARDGAERLDQAYRRLLDTSPHRCTTAQLERRWRTSSTLSVWKKLPVGVLQRHAVRLIDATAPIAANWST